jgi:hypothetical protein
MSVTLKIIRTLLVVLDSLLTKDERSLKSTYVVTEQLSNARTIDSINIIWTNYTILGGEMQTILQLF